MDGWMDPLYGIFLWGERSKPSKPKQAHKEHVKLYINSNSESNQGPWSYEVEPLFKKINSTTSSEWNNRTVFSLSADDCNFKSQSCHSQSVSRSQGSNEQLNMLAYSFFPVNHSDTSLSPVSVTRHEQQFEEIWLAGFAYLEETRASFHFPCLVVVVWRGEKAVGGEWQMSSLGRKLWEKLIAP